MAGKEYQSGVMGGEGSTVGNIVTNGSGECSKFWNSLSPETGKNVKPREDDFVMNKWAEELFTLFDTRKGGYGSFKGLNGGERGKRAKYGRICQDPEDKREEASRRREDHPGDGQPSRGSTLSVKMAMHFPLYLWEEETHTSASCLHQFIDEKGYVRGLFPQF